MARGAGGSGGVGALDIRGWGGGVVQHRESPDFRSLEVGRYAIVRLGQSGNGKFPDRLEFSRHMKTSRGPFLSEVTFQPYRT